MTQHVESVVRDSSTTKLLDDGNFSGSGHTLRSMGLGILPT